MAELIKRTWCYVQPPRKYDMPRCACGNENTQWSEYAKHLWCDVCKVDFIPEHNGIFDGPIPVQLCSLMGIKFDRIDLETMELVPFDLGTLTFNEELKLSWNNFLTPGEKDDNKDSAQV
jgi:hypothetical protein